MSHECNEDIRRTAVAANTPSKLERGSLGETVNAFAAKPSIVEFRGFQRRPTVLIEPIDISPYLNMTTGTQYNLISTKNGNRLSINPNFFKCRVNLARDDLWDLRASILFSEEKNYAFVSCKICKKHYPDLRKLRNHQEVKHLIVYQHDGKPQKRVSFSDHVIVHEVKEYHKCRKCTKIFENWSHLETHMRKDHKKRKCYICNYCDKQFVDRTIFKVHIKLHCDLCKLLLPTKSKYVEHRRSVCRVKKMHKCRTCNESYFKYMDLKEHSYDHMDSFFICDICKDQFQSECAVAHHIAFLHSEERPLALYELRNMGNDRLYLCNFCEETAVDKDTIEKHVELLPDLSNRIMTGYKDYYFCDQCLKKFGAEKEMLQHKWTHFLQTAKPASEEDSVTVSEEENTKTKKNSFNVNLPIPEDFKPKLVLERVKIPLHLIKYSKTVEEESLQKRGSPMDALSVLNFEADTSSETEYRKGIVKNIDSLKKPIMDPDVKQGKRRRVLLSKHQCELCTKYFSSGYCLRRHMQKTHHTGQMTTEDNLHCPVCEETFVWPSLLASHRCIRSHIPEMDFDDARPEILFDNLQDSLNDDYMNCVDFEIPAPIVTLTEFEENYVPKSHLRNALLNGSVGNQVQKPVEVPQEHKGYKVVVQEVPIEF